MVKIPSLDDLKKAGAGLVDSAKTVNISGVVDKLKAGVETITAKKDATQTTATNDPTQQLSVLQAKLAEARKLQVIQAAVVSDLENQIATLTKVIEANKQQ